MDKAASDAKTLDVLIVSAGISGIGMACHLQQDCPDRTFAILERRDAIGGPWDLFKYPGIRREVAARSGRSYVFCGWFPFAYPASGLNVAMLEQIRSPVLKALL